MKSLFCILLSMLFLYCPFEVIFAQSALTRALNAPRPGDRIVKQQIAYLEPGGTGENIIWDFSQQELVDGYYELKYSRYGDTDSIVGTEQRTLHYYKLSGDSLLLHGYENPTNLINYRNPEVLLIFPFTYGDSFTGYANSTGLYNNLVRLHVHGKSTVSVDACGTLILPEGDTLRHVLRVYTHRRSIAYPVKTDKDTLSEVLPADSIEVNDVFHNFPKSVDGYATKFGQWSTKVGADGKVYQWLKMPGSYGGKTGTFEYIKDANGIINHSFFLIHPDYERNIYLF